MGNSLIKYKQMKKTVILFGLLGIILCITKCSTNDSREILGKWVRPDGGYILEICNIHKDGKVEAKYFNPQPIHIAKAEIKEEGGNHE